MSGWKLDFLQDPEEYARTAQSQREYAREIAGRLERGESLSEMSSMAGPFAAAILRGWADNLPDAPPRKPGQAPQIDASNVALEYEAMIRNPHITTSKNAAKEKLAEKYGVSVEAIRLALKKKGADAKAFMDFGEQHGTIHHKQK